MGEVDVALSLDLEVVVVELLNFADQLVLQILDLLFVVFFDDFKFAFV